LMRGIGEKGRGYYFYIEKAKDITRIMSHSIHGLIDLIGSNCTVKFNNEGGELQQIYDFDSIDVPYPVGDLSKGGFVNVLLKYKVPPTKDDEFDLFSYDLQYLSNGEKREEIKLSGKFVIPCTSKYGDIEFNREVLISIKLKEYREANKLIKELINNNKIKEAIKKKEELMNELQELKTDHRVEVILEQEEIGLKALKDSLVNKNVKDRERAKKKFDANDYILKKENKFDYEYNDANDSSAEESDGFVDNGGGQNSDEEDTEDKKKKSRKSDDDDNYEDEDISDEEDDDDDIKKSNKKAKSDEEEDDDNDDKKSNKKAKSDVKNSKKSKYKSDEEEDDEKKRCTIN